MSKVLELREKRAKAWEAAKAFLDTKRTADGLLSAEDAQTYDKMEQDVVNLGKEVERLERQAVLDLELAAPTAKPAVAQPGAAPGADTKTGRASDEYKRNFWNVLRGKADAAVMNSLKVGEDEAGGYLVPIEYERKLITGLDEENIFRKLAHVIRTGGDRKIPVVATRGEASWVDEEGVIPESDDSFGQITLGAYKIATMIKVSEELVADNVFNLEGYIAQEFARRIGAKEEESFLTGDGIGKPTGLLHDTYGGEVGATAATATNVKVDDIIDLYYSLKAPYRRKATFVMHDQTVKDVRKFKDSTGNYLWQPSVKESEPDKILGRPIYTSVYMPIIAAGAKSVLFGDFDYYWIADRQGRVFRRLNELFAVTGQIAYLATQRVDGKLILPEAMKIMKMA